MEKQLDGLVMIGGHIDDLNLYSTYNVDFNPRNLGSVAVDVLIKHLQNQLPEKEFFLDTKLIIRESCISCSNL